MLKLSELKNDAMLCVRYCNDSDFVVMSKEDFLDSLHFLDHPEKHFQTIHLAREEIRGIDLQDIIEYVGDDTYDGWDEDVYSSLKDLPETVAFLQRVKEVLDNHPIYWEGQPVEIDMRPSQEVNDR